MRLSALVAALAPKHAPLRVVHEELVDEAPVRGLCIDSREVAPGDVFVALRGALADGHDHLEQALELGAAALVVERLPEALDLRARPAIVVADSRRALAPLAARFFGEPARELTMIGVTGTNGKTSTAYLIESILEAADRAVGLIGTVEVRFRDERRRALNTTPESLELQRTLRGMRTRGAQAVVMEVSSHGVELGRIDGCAFDVAAVTNVTQDHLDFHDSMEAYREAKLRLFRKYLRSGAGAVVNLDDPAAHEFLEAARSAGARAVRVTRQTDREAEVRLLTAASDLEGTRVRLAVPGDASLQLELPLVGDFNLENLLVAVGVAVCLDVPGDAIVRGVAACPQVPGRVERVAVRANAPTVLVDYAHTPDAVDKLLRAVRPLARARLVTVFGCGGDRDRGKRPLMAQAVAHWSDRVVVTSDNPRTEDPLAILADVEVGLEKLRRVEPSRLDETPNAYAVIPDRRRAIQCAIGLAGPDDTVVIAGKGHEDYQIVGRERLPFDDREEACRALDEGSTA